MKLLTLSILGISLLYHATSSAQNVLKQEYRVEKWNATWFFSCDNSSILNRLSHLNPTPNVPKSLYLAAKAGLERIGEINPTFESYLEMTVYGRALNLDCNKDIAEDNKIVAYETEAQSFFMARDGRIDLLNILSLLTDPTMSESYSTLLGEFFHEFLHFAGADNQSLSVHNSEKNDRSKDLVFACSTIYGDIRSDLYGYLLPEQTRSDWIPSCISCYLARPPILKNLQKIKTLNWPTDSLRKYFSPYIDTRGDRKYGKNMCERLFEMRSGDHLDLRGWLVR